MSDKKQKPFQLDKEQRMAIEALALITGKSYSDILDEAIDDLGKHRYRELIRESGLSVERLHVRTGRRSRKIEQ